MLVVALVIPATASARQATHDLDALPSRVRATDDLIVRDDRDGTTRGRLIGLTAGGLTLSVAGELTTIEAARIRSITRAYRDPRWTGAAIGFAVGTGIGAGIARSLMHEYREQDTE
ncbi:MAG TPA: hypothetical protein VG736_08000 [Vicinamibacterales bacterium]|nr:hypothetical protein [Vicinamibacterales bacterium]